MSILDNLRGKRASRDAAPEVATDDVSPVGNAMAVNDDARKKQQLLLGGAAAVLLVGASWYIFAPTSQLWTMLNDTDGTRQSGVAVLFHSRLVRPRPRINQPLAVR